MDTSFYTYPSAHEIPRGCQATKFIALVSSDSYRFLLMLLNTM